MRWLGLLLLVSFGTFADEAPSSAAPAVPSANYQTVELSVAGMSGNWANALSWNAFYSFGVERRFFVGFGIRLGSFWGGQGLAYRTAESSLIDQGNVTALVMTGAQTHSLNAVIQLRYQVVKRLELGLNIDLIGVGFGGPSIGEYEAASSQQARAASFNLLLGGNRDKGQLVSEFYAGFWITSHWGVRAGYSRLVSEVRTDAVLDFSNSRFRYTADLLFLSTAYKL